MNFRFHNLLAAPYRGGSLVMHGDTLLSPVGNRVAQVSEEEERREGTRRVRSGRPPTAGLQGAPGRQATTPHAQSGTGQV